MIEIPKPRAVIFDWDDTVVDSWPVGLASLNAALTAMGHPAWSDDEARRRAGPSAKDLFKSLFGDKWVEADKIYYDTFLKLSQSMKVHDKAEDVFKLLAERKIYMAVVSNKRGPLLREESSRLKFDKYFGKIVGAGDAEQDKPHPAPVIKALNGSGIQAGADVWFIGDSHTDMLCAKNTGCTGILIETKAPPEETLRAHPPAKRVVNHAKLMELIGGYFT